jgi:hypothetical protein
MSKCWICLNTFMCYLKAPGYVWQLVCFISKCLIGLNSLSVISNLFIYVETCVFDLKVLDMFEHFGVVSQCAGYAWTLLCFTLKLLAMFEIAPVLFQSAGCVTLCVLFQSAWYVWELLCFISRCWIRLKTFLVYRKVLDMFEDSCGLSQGAGTNLRGAIRNQIGTNFWGTEYEQTSAGQNRNRIGTNLRGAE